MTKNEYFDNIDKSFNFYQITDGFDGIVLVVNQQNEAVQFSSFKNSLLIKSSTNGRMAIQRCVYLGWMDDYGDFTAISLVGCFGGGGVAGSDNNNGGYPPHVGGGGSSGSVKITKDPCTTAQESTIVSKNKEYLIALKAINEANAAEEHSITLGKAPNGTMTQAPMNNGGQYIVQINTTWEGAFAALHNHPNNTPLSAGDIYASVQLNVKSSNFTTSYILTDGEVYAIVVTNLSLAQDFVKTYPPDQLPNQSPEFPNNIFYEIDGLKSIMGYGNEGRTTAIAFILDKYSAGITLLKQDSSGKFNPIKTQETTQSNGIKTYNTIPCN